MDHKYDRFIGPILQFEMQISCLGLKVRKMEALLGLLFSRTRLKTLRIDHENLSRDSDILELIVNWRQTSDTDI